MSQEKINSFLGRGWAFPVGFNKGTSELNMVEDEEDIRQSLKIILFTSNNERIMRPEFGSGLKDFIFEPANRGLLYPLKHNLQRAIKKFEPRINLEELDLDDSQAADGKLLIKIDYTIRSVNVRTNIVFPFYFNEGTHVTDM